MFVGYVFAGSGNVIAWTKVPPICSPTIRTCGTFPAVTWATNALYGSVTSDVCLGKSDQRFHAINRKKTIHDSGLTRYGPGDGSCGGFGRTVPGGTGLAPPGGGGGTCVAPWSPLRRPV